MLRLTGGEFRGRFIDTLPGQDTRPTQAKLRQALFNSIQMEIPDAMVLDLFAGSGALGFEALSRGAAQAVFVENSKGAIRVISKNISTLGVKDRAQIVSDSVSGFVPRVEALLPFDVVFADPPYAAGWEERLLRELPWERLLRPGGIFCLEWGTQKSVVSELPDSVPFLAKVREKNYGDSVLSTFRRTEDSSV